MPRPFENYHCHSWHSNIFFWDSPVSKADYARRAVELNHKLLSGCEHGYQGNWLETLSAAEKHGLQFLYATEAYWVNDRLSDDAQNNHIVLIARNMDGVRALNAALSEASETGYLRRPRMDKRLILSLNPKDVYVTTACLAFWGYGFQETLPFLKDLKDHFGDSLFLEVQPHYIARQVELNEHIIRLSKSLHIPMIAGCDSHFILPEQAEERKNLQAGYGGMKDLDAEGALFMDYPDGDELFRRFQNQGVLSDAQIEAAMEQTLIFREAEPIAVPRAKKIPNPYRYAPPPLCNLTAEERAERLRDLVRRAWKARRASIPRDLWPQYEEAIRYELDTITETESADYFLGDYELVQKGKAKGGVLTQSGRGSGPSYYVNSLLGFSSMDRIALPLKLYPDRFISKPRLLAGQLPDLDLNVADRKPFLDALPEVYGEGHFAPMIAYSAQKRKAAFKMYARASGMEPAQAERIAKHLERYDNVVKYADEDEKDAIDLSDYVDASALKTVEESEKYTRIVVNKIVHPCAVLIYDGDIRSEIGLVRAKSDSGKLDELVTVIDGVTADAYGFVKNDLLRVTVWELIDKLYKAANLPLPDAMELLKWVENDPDTFRIFADGLTLGVNQCEREATLRRLKRYKPRNFTELAAFVAAIRPGFKSNLEAFLRREPFSYGIQEFDEAIQSPQLPYSYMLFQENIMSAFAFAGFSPSDCYANLKHVAKKHPDEIAKIKPAFLKGFVKRCLESPRRYDGRMVKAAADKVWTVIEDAANYSFVAAHAAAVAFDALYVAYAKAHYPLIAYRVMLNTYAAGSNKDKLTAIKNEMANGFSIRLAPAQFGEDNTAFAEDAVSGSIRDALPSMPYMSRALAEALATCPVPDTFTGFLLYAQANLPMDARQTERLIRTGYFSRYGASEALLALFKEFRSGKLRITKALSEKSRAVRIPALMEMESRLTQVKPDALSECYRVASAQAALTGSPSGVFPGTGALDYAVISVPERASGSYILYSLARGTSGPLRMKKDYAAALKLSPGDILRLVDYYPRPEMDYRGDKPKPIPGTKVWWIGCAQVLMRASWASPVS